MSNKILAAVLVSAAMAVAVSAAPDLSGTYTTPNQVGGVLTVELVQAPDGRLHGRISSNGVEFALDGSVDADGLAHGSVAAQGAMLVFEAELDGADLYFTFGEPAPDGSIDLEAATEWVLSRQGARAPTVAPVAGNPLAAGPASGGNPLAGGAPAPDPLVGRFTDGNLTLDVQGGGGAYRATITMAGQSFPAQLQGSGGRAAGSFTTADGSQWPIALTREGDAVHVESQGATYRLRPAGGNPLAGGAVPGGAPQAAPGVAGDVLAQGPHGTLTRDNARAFLEALVFCLQQLGAHQVVAGIDESQFYSLMAQSYPQAPPDVQAELASARQIWTQVQQAWPTLGQQQQLQFAHLVIQLALGPQAATQLTGLSAGSGGSGGSSGTVPGFDVNPSYEGQGCWAAAGCGGYETSTGDVVDYGGGVE